MPSDGSTILFRRAPRALNRPQLRAFVKTIIAEVASGRPFTALVTDDAELQRLNLTFLGKDEPTDVLSFPSMTGEASLGEVAVSHHRATAQAEELGHPVEVEMQVLILHGLLHLLGHDHENDRGAMRRLEIKWRKQLGLPAGLIERTSR